MSRGSLISEAQAFGQSANAPWTTYKRYALHRPGEDALGQAYVQANGLGDTLGAKLVSLTASSPAFASTLAAQRTAFNGGVDEIAKIESTIYDPILKDGNSAITSDIAATRRVILGGFGVLAVLYRSSRSHSCVVPAATSTPWPPRPPTFGPDRAGRVRCRAPTGPRDGRDGAVRPRSHPEGAQDRGGGHPDRAAPRRLELRPLPPGDLDASPMWDRVPGRDAG